MKPFTARSVIEDNLKTERRASMHPKVSREDEERTDVIDGGI